MHSVGLALAAISAFEAELSLAVERARPSSGIAPACS